MVDIHQQPGKRRGNVGQQWHANTHRGVGHGNPRVRTADTPTAAAAHTAAAPHRHTSLRDAAVGTGTRSDTVRRDHQSHTTQSLATLTQPTAHTTTACSTQINTNALQVYKPTTTRPRGGRGQRQHRGAIGTVDTTHTHSRPAAACTRRSGDTPAPKSRHSKNYV